MESSDQETIKRSRDNQGIRTESKQQDQPSFSESKEMGLLTARKIKRPKNVLTSDRTIKDHFHQSKILIPFVNRWHKVTTPCIGRSYYHCKLHIIGHNLRERILALHSNFLAQTVIANDFDHRGPPALPSSYNTSPQLKELTKQT